MKTRCSLWFCWRKAAGAVEVEYLPGITQRVELCDRHKEDGMQAAMQLLLTKKEEK